jgi:hypothetical protein
MAPGRRGWEWHPAPGWPRPPGGWTPPYGWVPDPSWPSADQYYDGWRRTRRSARRVRILAIVVGTPLVLIAGAFGAAIVYGVVTNDPCAFDPPPGDVGSIPIVNNTSNQVTVFDCDSDTCKSGINYTTVKAGHTYSEQYEMCSGTSVGVKADNGVLLGCLVLPVGEPPKITRLEIASAQACPT